MLFAHEKSVLKYIIQVLIETILIKDMSNPADELTQLKNRIELYEKELDDITQKITDLLNESTLTSNAEEVAKIYGIAILQYQKLVKAYKEYIDSVERNI